MKNIWIDLMWGTCVCIINACYKPIYHLYQRRMSWCSISRVIRSGQLISYRVVSPFYDCTYFPQPDTILPMNIQSILKFELQQPPSVTFPMFSPGNYREALVWLHIKIDERGKKQWKMSNKNNIEIRKKKWFVDNILANKTACAYGNFRFQCD